MSITSLLKSAIGFDKLTEKLRSEITKSKEELDQIKQETVDALEAKKKVIETPKEIATRRSEPWVSVLDVNIDKKNPRNGYFELDWNHIFIEHLIIHGFGFENDPEEEIVDRWFRTLTTNMLAEHDIDSSYTTGGYINIKQLTKDHSEAS